LIKRKIPKQLLCPIQKSFNLTKQITVKDKAEMGSEKKVVVGKMFGEKKNARPGIFLHTAKYKQLQMRKD